MKKLFTIAAFAALGIGVAVTPANAQTIVQPQMHVAARHRPQWNNQKTTLDVHRGVQQLHQRVRVQIQEAHTKTGHVTRTCMGTALYTQCRTVFY